jgi:hypothetical protein
MCEAHSPLSEEASLSSAKATGVGTDGDGPKRKPLLDRPSDVGDKGVVGVFASRPIARVLKGGEPAASRLLSLPSAAALPASSSGTPVFAACGGTEREAASPPGPGPSRPLLTGVAAGPEFVRELWIGCI